MKRIRKQFLFALAAALTLTTTGRAADITAAEARAIAKEAYIYGYPMVDSYRIEYAYFVNTNDPEYKAPWNEIKNIPSVYTPADTAIQTPNSDTPYSWLGLDLRTEPMVLTMPVIEKERYFSVQFTDLYTFNFDYLGSRTSGNDGGSFLIAGPGWKGETPKGVKKVLHCETELTLVVYRTQLFDPGDIHNVKKIQAGYKVQPLSAFLGTAASKVAPAIDFIKPITHDEEKTSLQVFSILNFILSPEMKTAFEQGVGDAWAEFAGGVKLLDTGKLKSGDLFGTREFMKNNYLNRWLATIGIWGNSKQEAMYPIYRVDADGQKLEGANRYSLRFAPGQLPPVHAFWSLTMYELPQSLLVANPINRYLINSPMLPQLKKDADGGLALYMQNESPGKDKESNWLPAPKGPFAMYMRLYWPKKEATEGKWTAPPLKKAE
jgi:hypothetical protein